MFSINTIQEILAGLKHNMLRTVLTGLFRNMGNIYSDCAVRCWQWIEKWSNFQFLTTGQPTLFKCGRGHLLFPIMG